jgi:hypothetical protein
MVMHVAYLVGNPNQTDFQTDMDRPMRFPSLTLECDDHLVAKDVAALEHRVQIRKLHIGLS